MVGDSDSLKHDRRPYERPGCRHRCGREARWGPPCHRGPNPDGSCGGTAECAPFRNAHGGVECRRPAAAGGPCAEGPTPQGRCSQQHPPCAPQLTLRALRGRLAAVAVGAVVALIAALAAASDGAKRKADSALDPLSAGPLSAVHAGAVKERGCAACHAGHPTEHEAWVKQIAMTPDFVAQCGSCHAFGGKPGLAHNTAFPERADLKPATCVMCHTEHRGRDASPIAVDDAQCQSCHRATFASFTDGHPPFSATFPHDRRGGIQFDHAAHLTKHFKEPRHAGQAPASCTSCHAVTDAGQRAVQTAPFAQACAGCHAPEIARKPLVVFRFPELAKAAIDLRLAAQLCPATPPADPAAAPEPVSTESPTAITAMLLDVPADDPQAYSAPVHALVAAMAKDGPAALAERLDRRLGQGAGARLLAGLSPEVVRQAACAWLANQEYEPPAEAALGGWHADLLELRYTPAGHADPVMTAWLEAGIAAAATATGEAPVERATAMREGLLSRLRGPGRCTTCHAVTERAGAGSDGRARLAIAWGYDAAPVRPHTRFSHGAHLNVLATPDACATCHLLNERADYAASFASRKPEPFAGNFHAIRNDTCLQCHTGSGRHAAGQARQDCLLCHTYHPPGLRQAADAAP
jgi:hypothetical protein